MASRSCRKQAVESEEISEIPEIQGSEVEIEDEVESKEGELRSKTGELIEMQIVEDDCIKISIVSGAFRYEDTLRNFIKCQKPKDFMTADACREVILEDIEKFTMKANETNINVSYNVFKKNFIRFELPRVEIIGEIDTEMKVKVINERLAKLEASVFPKPVPHDKERTFIHVYPKWKTFEEFKKLKDYKYFDAVNNPPASFLQLYTEANQQKRLILETKQGIRLGFSFIYKISSENDLDLCLTNVGINTGVNVYNLYYPNRAAPEDRKLDIEFQRVRSESSDMTRQGKSAMLIFDEQYFYKSVEVPKYKSTKFFNPCLINYFKKIILGWIILNIKDIYDKEINFNVKLGIKESVLTITWSKDTDPEIIRKIEEEEMRCENFKICSYELPRKWTGSIYDSC